MPLGAVCEVLLYDARDGLPASQSNPTVLLGYIAGVLTRMEDPTGEGMEVILSDVIGSSGEASAIVRGELGRHGEHLRIHLCGTASRDCKYRRPLSEELAEQYGLGLGILHCNEWRIRTPKDLMHDGDDWLAGQYTGIWHRQSGGEDRSGRWQWLWAP